MESLSDLKIRYSEEISLETLNEDLKKCLCEYEDYKFNNKMIEAKETRLKIDVIRQRINYRKRLTIEGKFYLVNKGEEVGKKGRRPSRTIEEKKKRAAMNQRLQYYRKRYGYVPETNTELILWCEENNRPYVSQKEYILNLSTN